MAIGSKRGGWRHDITLWCVPLLLIGAGGAHAAPLTAPPGGLCTVAIQTAETRYALPHGLLFAIGQVESGRPDAATRQIVPWPWAVQAQNESYYFPSKAAAVQWVRAAEVMGVVSIDVGCMQVNLMYHPDAFRTLNEAFDPSHNTDYAARFLISLHASSGDWQEATGLYHSETMSLAMPYRRRVEDALEGRPWDGTEAAPKPTKLEELQAAWGATLEPQNAAPARPRLTGDWGALRSAHASRRLAHLRHLQRPILLSDAH